MLVLSFFFTCEAKKKESTKEKRNHAGFLRLRFAQPFLFLFGFAESLMLASHFAMLRLTLAIDKAELCLKHEVQVCEAKAIFQLQSN